MHARVYVAGPMAGLNRQAMLGWRLTVAESLRPAEVINPLRGFIDKIAPDGKMIAGHEQDVLRQRHELTSRDLWDVMRSDLVFVDFSGATRVSIGTILEMGVAWTCRTPIIVVMDQAGLHDHPMIREMAMYVVPTLSEAIQLTRDALNLPTGRR